MDLMNKYKSEFIVKYGILMQENAVLFQELKKAYLKEWGKNKIYILILFLFLIVIVKLLLSKEIIWNLIIITAFLSIITTVFLGMRKIINKKYQNEVKSRLFDTLVKVFGDVSYTNWNYKKYQYDGYSLNFEGYDIDRLDTAEMLWLKNNKIRKGKIYDQWDAIKKENMPYYIKKEIINDSNLFFPNQITDKIDDDVFKGCHNSINFQINETHLLAYLFEKGKSSDVYRGVALLFDIPKSISSQVIIQTKNIPYKFVNKWDYEKINLESVEFSTKYEAFVEKKSETSYENQIEARYILTTAMVDRLTQIQTSFNVKNIRCSFWDNKLLILLASKKDLFEMPSLYSPVEDVKYYSKLFEEFSSIFSFIDVLNLASKTGL